MVAFAIIKEKETQTNGVPRMVCNGIRMENAQDAEAVISIQLFTVHLVRDATASLRFFSFTFAEAVRFPSFIIIPGISIIAFESKYFALMFSILLSSKELGFGVACVHVRVGCRCRCTAVRYPHHFHK